MALRHQNVPSRLKEMLVSQYWPEKELEKLQLNKLKELVRYVKSYVPYYKEKFSGVSEQDINNLTDIQKLGFTTKPLIKTITKEFISTQRLWLVAPKTTGGSTGEPVTLWKTPDAMARALAATWRGYSWAGIDIGDRQGRFWGVPFKFKARARAKLIDLVNNRRRCSAFSFDEKNLNEYTKILKSFKPTYFYGYVSMLTEYAEYFRKNNVKPPFNLKCIIVTSEVLTKYHRQLLESTFSVRVFNEYGCGEMGSVAHECEKGSMHIMSENLIVEVLDGDRVCKPGEIGELVITELNNRAMPLIRYRIGDFASLSPDKCACGRTLPGMVNLAGRAYDMIRNRAGRLFHGEFFMYIIEDAKKNNLGIGAFQIIQLDYDKFKIRIKPETGYSEKTEDFIVGRIKKDFDQDAIIEFEKVSRIERAASGKMRLIIGMNR